MSTPWRRVLLLLLCLGLLGLNSCTNNYHRQRVRAFNSGRLGTGSSGSGGATGKGWFNPNGIGPGQSGGRNDSGAGSRASAFSNDPLAGLVDGKRSKRPNSSAKPSASSSSRRESGAASSRRPAKRASAFGSDSPLGGGGPGRKSYSPFQ